MSKGEVVTSPVHNGQRSLKIGAAKKSTSRIHQTEVISPGKTYEVEGWISVQSIQAGAKLELEWRTNKGSISTVTVGGTMTGTAGWTERAALLVAPSNATRARLNLLLGKESDGAGNAWFDELSLVRSN